MWYHHPGQRKTGISPQGAHLLPVETVHTSMPVTLLLDLEYQDWVTREAFWKRNDLSWASES